MIVDNMKLIVTINDGTLAGRHFELNKGHLSIGRGEHCSIKFDPLLEKIASKQHAFIEKRSDGFYITDNNSTNGTLVNGEKIQSVRLNSGDSIQFGKNGAMASVLIKSDEVSVPTFEERNKSPNAQEMFEEFQVQQTNQNFESQPQTIQDSFAGIGFGTPEVAPPQTSTGKYVVLGIMIFLIVLLFVPVLLILGLSLGPIVAIIATFVAFLPATIYLIPLAWLDRYDPEPLWLLATSFAWGGVVAVFVSFIINTLFGTIAAVATQSLDVGNLVGAVISAPIFEEMTKGIGVLALLLFFRREFDDILDGIVFAGVIALGFATVENVLYYGRSINTCGAEGLTTLFFVRGILSPFAHVTFTAMIGIGCGIARESHNTIIRIFAVIGGYIAAVVLHMIWNGMSIAVTLFLIGTGLIAFCPNLGGPCSISGLCPFFIAYIILQIPFFILFVIFSLWMMRRQNRILKEMLAFDVARGLIPQEHLDKVTSAFGSLFWALAGITSGKYLARRRYMRAIGKLGLSYWHIQRATSAQGHTGSFQQNPILKAEVEKWRDQV